MDEKVTIPAETVRMLVDSFIMNEFKVSEFKWVMKKYGAIRQEYEPVGDIEVTVEK